MGYNTVAVFFNDQTNEWPQRMREAMNAFRGQRSECLRESGWFGFGQIASVDHANGTQVVVAGGNTARRVSPLDPAEQADLDALADVLKAHGYTIKRPGRSQSEGPHCWGYWARNRGA